jgi:hypothetical protein
VVASREEGEPLENNNPCSPHGHIDNREIGRIRPVGYLTLQEE